MLAKYLNDRTSDNNRLSILGIAMTYFGGNGQWEMLNVNYATKVSQFHTSLIQGNLLYLFTSRMVQCINIDRQRIEWESDFNDFLSVQPQIIENVLYFKTQGNSFYAMDATTGSLKWRADNVGEGTHNFGIDKGKMYFFSYMAVPRFSGDQVFLNVLDANSGTILHQHANPDYNKDNGIDFLESIAVRDNTIYCVDSKRLLALRFAIE